MAIKFSKKMELASGDDIEITTGPNGGKILRLTVCGENPVSVVLTREEYRELKAEL